MNFRFSLLLLLLFLFKLPEVKAQLYELPPIQLDRPDLTESPFLTLKKYLQVESGFLLEQNSNSDRSFTAPTMLIKYGISDNFELRLVTELVTTSTSVTSTKTAISPIWIGFKTPLLKEKGIIPKTSFIAHLAIPTFSYPTLNNQHIAPQFRFVMQHTLSDKFSLAYNAGMEWDGINVQGVFIYTLTTGYSITERLGCFVEGFGYYQPSFFANHHVDGGVTYALNKNSVIDFSLGYQYYGNNRTNFISCGYSFRLNTSKQLQSIFVK
jgi:hypothetical protein